jgi:molybdopterin molybdotransferase
MKMRDTYNGEYFTSFNEALRMVREMVAPVGTEERPVGKCAGFVSAGTAISRITSPSVRTSLKDGFAVRTADIPGSKLRIAGSIAAGKYQGEILAGQAVKVFTGAPVPRSGRGCCL